ncbi:hypothetical protein HZ326_19463 [Fusarium oxysporum f. sp. albedinis]|nr:hypothetical protein HZ326_19463 [Fusarium oxysporum f. sp. albedinis]
MACLRYVNSYLQRYNLLLNACVMTRSFVSTKGKVVLVDKTLASKGIARLHHIPEPCYLKVILTSKGKALLSPGFFFVLPTKLLPPKTPIGIWKRQNGTRHSWIDVRNLSSTALTRRLPLRTSGRKDADLTACPGAFRHTHSPKRSDLGSFDKVHGGCSRPAQRFRAEVLKVSHALANPFEIVTS